MKNYHYPSRLLFCFSCFIFQSASAESGSFSTLTYNVAGLLEIFSSAESDRQSATELISCYVNEFDIVNVQEDFNYHAALYDTCNTHPYRTSTTGGMGFGSGLNTMSHFPFEDLDRVSWENCNGVDCLTPKGFTLTRMRLDDGVYVDVYNLHTQAQVEPLDLAARRANILQLVDYIETNSVGNAVIVFGDTNTRYTREGDNIREFLNRGFKDAWLEQERHGDVPNFAPNALDCSPKKSSANCEIVDKILYRSSPFMHLQLVHFDIRQDDETNEGLKLSDHPPVQANWQYTTRTDRKLSNTFGGPHGISFNDIVELPVTPVVKSVHLRAGRRVDQLGIMLQQGDILRHGGMGGREQSLTLSAGEYVEQLQVCSAKYSTRTRIFYAQFSTNLGRTLTGGHVTAECTTFNAPAGWQIVGFHGRSGDEVDKVGVIYAPYLTSAF